MKEEEINEDALTPQLTEHLVKHIGTMWKRLARELNFSEDEIIYFESDNDNDQERTPYLISITHTKKTCTKLESWTFFIEMQQQK
jgi:hypothetical protein